MRKYYHIQADVRHITKEFVPRIPRLRYEFEDGTIPRISLSASLEGCLTGVPWGGGKLEDLISAFSEFHNSEEYPFIFRVYEFNEEDIQPGNLVTTEELLKRGLVMDANASNEVWVVDQTLHPSNTYIAFLEDYSETVTDTFTQEFYTIEDNRDIDFDEFYIGSPLVIDSANVIPYPSLESLPISVDFLGWNTHLKLLRDNQYRGFK